MTNEEWTVYDTEEGRLVLTDKAPPEAIKSYEDYLNFYEDTSITGI